MTRFSIPFRPASGDQEIVEQIIGDFDHIQDIGNGSLQAGTNVKTAPPPDPLTGNSNAEGVSDALARADHAHVIRGVEQLAVTPTGSHFPGRVFYNTTTSQHMTCTDIVAGTYVPFTNVAATDVAIHGSRHGVGGGDPLPNLGVTSDMLGRSVQTKVLPGPITNLKNSWTTLLAMDPITLVGSQVITFSGKMICNNVTGNIERFSWRIMDTNPTTPVFVCGSMGMAAPQAMASGHPVSDIVQQATGTHIYQLQGWSSVTVNGFDVQVTNSALSPQALGSYLGLVVG